MDQQEVQKSTGIAGQENQENNASKKFVFIDFEYFFSDGELKLNLDDRESYFKYDSEGRNILGPYIMQQGDIWSFDKSISKDAFINPNYNKKLVKDTTKLLLKGKSDTEKYKKLIVDSLEAGHKVVISAYTCYPHAVTATLQHIGLDKNQIKDILILFSAENKFRKCNKSYLYTKILGQNRDAAQQLTGIKNIDPYINLESLSKSIKSYQN
ncbi:hypothetical protein [Cardinium endosymbiont of Dermatophagoides farinae]|uniref:hypothetical protein n=1 Tax=Cardinium endosymbiont of Dermatophagoides farinae TaxID=2597823 RepID=UPI001183DEE7|nr:hypothetical protein [Cardinium endosymbiont of Dermatophagoides farinae]TSJ80793.1 hypothetical protein FPG78_01875 [Cardinium endosymbiont of Dermatophagoides farinae]